MKLFTNIHNFDIEQVFIVKTSEVCYKLKYVSDLFELNELPLKFQYLGPETIQTIHIIEKTILEIFIAHHFDTKQMVPTYHLTGNFAVMEPGDFGFIVMRQICVVDDTRCFIDFTFSSRKNESMKPLHDISFNGTHGLV